MTGPANEKPGCAHDEPYTHRFYPDADAVAKPASCSTTPTSSAFPPVHPRLNRPPDPTRLNPEKGGHYTSYHAAGLLFAVDYYSLIADDDLRAQLQPMLARGMQWLRARTRPDRFVDPFGNSRTGAQLGDRQERGPQGNLKTMSFGSAYRPSLDYAMITGEPARASEAALLYHDQDVEKPPAQGLRSMVRSAAGSFSFGSLAKVGARTSSESAGCSRLRLRSGLLHPQRSRLGQG